MLKPLKQMPAHVIPFFLGIRQVYPCGAQFARRKKQPIFPWRALIIIRVYMFGWLLQFSPFFVYDSRLFVYFVCPIVIVAAVLCVFTCMYRASASSFTCALLYWTWAQFWQRIKKMYLRYFSNREYIPFKYSVYLNNKSMTILNANFCFLQ